MKKNGFTLIEIVIAIAILSTAVIPFMMVLTQNLKVSALTKQKYISSHYARALAEEIKLKQFGTTSSALTTNAAISAGDRNGVFDVVEDYKGYDESVLAGGKGIRDLSGNIIDTNYYRKVKVIYADDINLADMEDAVSGTTKKITVECWSIGSESDEMAAEIVWYVSAGG